ncbi:MAG: hypothetical protein H6697_03075 [Myxococcales bacterium]|nr:hypothetical protein [Myxococcales bacterium]MCB9520684.1 hypothetical protein [Myxococcales bacterium]
MSRLLLICALGGAPLAAACSDASDPFAVADTGADTTRDSGGDAAADTTGTDTGGGTDTTADTGGGTDATTEETGADVDDVDAGGGDSGTDGSDAGIVCGEGVVFTGQVHVSDTPDPTSPNGGAPRFEPYDGEYDAGVAAVIEAAPATGDPVEVELELTDATVVATSYNTDTQQRAQYIFWIADAGGTVQVFLPSDDTAGQPPFSVKVGQRVSATVTAVGVYQGMAQVTAASDWTLGSEGNEVFVLDVGAERAVTAADAHAVVRATGTLTSIDQPDCGGATCYLFDYGAEAPITLRSSSSFLSVGQCATFVGPVRLFSGAPQFDTINFDWLWTYGD